MRNTNEGALTGDVADLAVELSRFELSHSEKGEHPGIQNQAESVQATAHLPSYCTAAPFYRAYLFFG